MQDEPHRQPPIDEVQGQRTVNVAFMMDMRSDDGHAFQRGVQPQAEQCRPRKLFPGRWCFALRPVLVGVEMAVLDALTQEFQQPLQQESRHHTKSSRRRASKGFGDEVQKAHGNDESPAKRQDESQVVDAPLAHQHKQPTSEERSRQKQRSGQKHAVKGWWVCVRESWFWASQVSTWKVHNRPKRGHFESSI